MNETTSLLTGGGSVNKDENPTEKSDKVIGRWQQLKLVAVAVAVVVVFSGSSTRRQPMEEDKAFMMAEPLNKLDTFQLTQEQNLELWDHWKEYLSWQDIWNEAHDTWNDAQERGKKAWDEAKEEADQAWEDAEKQGERSWNDAQEEANSAWEEAKEQWDKTNFADIFHPTDIMRHTQIREGLTPEEGQKWWEDAKNYYNDLSDSVVQNDILWIHTGRTSHTRLGHRHKDEAKNNNVYMNHSEAFLMLHHEAKKGGPHEYSMDYFLLNQGLDAQINQAYCAVASSMAVLNSLRAYIDLPQDPIYDPYPYATQVDAFNECTDNNVKVKNDTFDGVLSAPFGLNLNSAKSLLECHLPSDQWKVEAYHVDADITLSHMRGQMKDALTNPTSRVMVNYHRAIAGQVGGGHFSPIGAYNPSTDSFLIMDVAKYKYPPVWISTESLYQSLFATDSCGHWLGPAAQASLPPALLHPTTVKELAAAMALLGCQAAPRGYIIVSKRKK